MLCSALCSCAEAACAADRDASHARAACLRPCSPGLLVRNTCSWLDTSPLENSACTPHTVRHSHTLSAASTGHYMLLHALQQAQ